MRILVVEDERKVASFISQGLAEEGHAVEVAADGAEALDLILAGPPYDLVVLDLMLPKRDGFGVLKTVRDRGVATPVLVLTARDSVADKVAGFDLGADDYLTKPFAFEEFLARVRALLRRGAGGGRRVGPTPGESAPLESRGRNAGRAPPRRRLAGHGGALTFDSERNVMDVCGGSHGGKRGGWGERRLNRRSTRLNSSQGA